MWFLIFLICLLPINCYARTAILFSKCPDNIQSGLLLHGLIINSDETYSTYYYCENLNDLSIKTCLRSKLRNRINNNDFDTVIISGNYAFSNYTNIHKRCNKLITINVDEGLINRGNLNSTKVSIYTDYSFDDILDDISYILPLDYKIIVLYDDSYFSKFIVETLKSSEYDDISYQKITSMFKLKNFLLTVFSDHDVLLINALYEIYEYYIIKLDHDYLSKYIKSHVKEPIILSIGFSSNDCKYSSFVYYYDYEKLGKLISNSLKMETNSTVYFKPKSIINFDMCTRNSMFKYDQDLFDDYLQCQGLSYE